MKLIVAWPASWLLYLLGDLLSYPMSYFTYGHIVYPLYNWLMVTSGTIQDWGAPTSGPWGGNDEPQG